MNNLGKAYGRINIHVDTWGMLKLKVQFSYALNLLAMNATIGRYRRCLKM